MTALNIGITIDHGEQFDNQTEVAERLRNALSEADAELADAVTVHTDDEHPDWAEDGCPECGSHRLSVMEPRELIYHIEDGDWEFLDHGEVTGTNLSIFCINCDTELTEHPASALLHYY